MTLHIATMSHSPLLDYVQPEPAIVEEVDEAFRTVRDHVQRYDPDLIINIGPDHYNGFFYDLMPPFCVGWEAEAIGDFNTQSGALDVPTDLARSLTEHVLEAGVDVAVSLRMQVDHGAVQPMELIYGDIRAKPVIPIFVNSVAPPFTPLRRVRQLGQAIGSFVAEELTEQKVLIIGSGGLSHEPPVPQLDTAPTEVRANLLGDGRNLSREARDARQTRVIDAARAFASGAPGTKPLNPTWDRQFIEILASGDLTPIDNWTPAEMTEIAGNSSHEVRTWIVAYEALSTQGSFLMEYSYYRPIPEYIAGFGATIATPTVGSASTSIDRDQR